jgi:hypothetical protein
MIPKTTITVMTARPAGEKMDCAPNEHSPFVFIDELQEDEKVKWQVQKRSFRSLLQSYWPTVPEKQPLYIPSMMPA